jgi:hypothetical protein
MWQTSTGTRVLSGGERAFICAAIDSMLDRASAEWPGFGSDPECHDWPFLCGRHSGGPFDSLPPVDQLLVLRAVLRALLDPLAPAPELTANFESAVYYPIRFARQEHGVQQGGGESYEESVFREYFADTLLNALAGDDGRGLADVFDDDDDDEVADGGARSGSAKKASKKKGKPAPPAAAPDPMRRREELKRRLWDAIDGEDVGFDDDEASPYEVLANRILWDRDFQYVGSDEDDADEGRSALARLMLGYPTSGAAQLQALRAEWQDDPLRAACLAPAWDREEIERQEKFLDELRSNPEFGPDAVGDVTPPLPLHNEIDALVRAIRALCSCCGGVPKNDSKLPATVCLFGYVRAGSGGSGAGSSASSSSSSSAPAPAPAVGTKRKRGASGAAAAKGGVKKEQPGGKRRR